MYGRLREEARKQGFSIHALAKKSGIAPTSLYSAFSGNSAFWPGWRKRVSEALGVSEEELFREEENNGKDAND